ncbi:MAG: FAD-dependent oxidoreductase, partial [Coriobacteriales bacterium]
WAQDLLPEGQKAFVPSVVEPYHDPKKTKAITRDEMDKVLQHHVDAIKRCKQAGFDQVMVHCAHGNLLSSFLSPAWNHRTDKYGGSFENRIRFPLEVLEAAHEATGGDIPIEIRFVGNEWIENGMPLEERIEFLKRAQKYIDMVVVSAGTLKIPGAFSYNMPGYYNDEMLNVEYAAAYKEACPDLCISVCGGISTLEQAEYIISTGKADVVAMAKALMADGDYVNKGLRGEEDDIRPCMRCLWCLRNVENTAHLEGCAVNPIMGWEYRGTKLIPIADKKKAMVVGGGPGGMEATRVLAARGFDVVLYEKEQTLGGRLPEVSSLYLKTGFRRYFKWAVRKTMECGARIELGKEVTPEVIRSEAPDYLILATGADLIKPPIPGIDGPNVVDVVKVDRGEVQTGKRVVVCGAGLSGAECALELAVGHKQVTLVDMIPEEDFYKDLTFFMKPMLDKDLAENNVTLRGNCKIKEFTAKGVVVENEKGKEELIEADTVVLALGVRPNSAKIAELSDVVPATYLVGDCKKSGVVGDSINQAYWLCRDLD